MLGRGEMTASQKSIKCIFLSKANQRWSVLSLVSGTGTVCACRGAVVHDLAYDEIVRVRHDGSSESDALRPAEEMLDTQTRHTGMPRA